MGAAKQGVDRIRPGLCAQLRLLHRLIREQMFGAWNHTNHRCCASVRTFEQTHREAFVTRVLVSRREETQATLGEQMLFGLAAHNTVEGDFLRVSQILEASAVGAIAKDVKVGTQTGFVDGFNGEFDVLDGDESSHRHCLIGTI